jgi:hypothetical protein
MVFLALKTFDLVFKVVRTDFGTRSKGLIMVNLVPVANFLPYLLANRTFDLVIKIVSSYFSTRSTV